MYGVKKLVCFGCVCFCKKENIIVFVIICGFLDKLVDFVFIFIGDLFFGFFVFFLIGLIINLLLIMMFKFLCYI